MKHKADFIIINATGYTVDNEFSICSAIAVKGGKILDVGNDNYILDNYKSSEVLDLKGAPLYPGFNDAHCHISMLGVGLSRVDLRAASSFEEILDRLKERFDESNPSYLAGDGWDQTLWGSDEFPSNTKLNELFPDIPVVLFRVDFHAVIVNDVAIRLLGITPGDPSIPADEAIMENGKFKGVFLENSASRFESVLPEPTTQELADMIIIAQDECFRNGLTSITNAGGSSSLVDVMDRLNSEGKLKIRTNLVLTPSEDNLVKYTSPYINNRIRISTIKLFADGALGSRGALMLEPYSDMNSTKGISVISQGEFERLCKWAYDHDFQVAMHCIGDAANRQALNTYAKFLEPGNDRRWRIEHAQIIAPEDVHLFGKYSIVPSIQPTHATSDMLWADERIGDRLKNAYIYKELLDQLGWIPSGTDFPVEEVNPIYTFHSAVYRQNLDFVPPEGFQMENALTKEEALKSMTIWAAKASFEEKLKGSLEAGKYADFVVLDKDIMRAPANEIPGINVMMTFVNGEKVFEKR
ncbi:MAG: amidohydrolase [Bacteroidales bacterium]